MTYGSIRKFEVGLKENTKVPQQQRVQVYKPLLFEVIDSVETFISKQKLSLVGYKLKLNKIPRAMNFISLNLKMQ